MGLTLPISRALRCSFCILTKWVLVSLLLWVLISPTFFNPFIAHWWFTWCYDERKRALLEILDEHTVWILMHHPTFLTLWIILTMGLFLILTTFAYSQSLVFWSCHLSPVGDFLNANDGKRELSENIWRPSYTCLRHILSTLPLLMTLAILLSAPSANSSYSWLDFVLRTLLIHVSP